MAEYRVLSPLDHDGKHYDPDAAVEIADDQQAQALLDVNVIAPASDGGGTAAADMEPMPPAKNRKKEADA